MKTLVVVIFVCSVFFFLFYGSAAIAIVHAQSDLQTTKYRNMVIDLGDGLKTNARLNLPSIGDGPFPAVLLVPGSGPVDMNETGGAVRIDNETGSIIYPPARPFFDIAQYLSERGFAVNLSNTSQDSIAPQIAVSGSNVYVVWVEKVSSSNWEVFFRRSTNGGASFDPAINLSNTSGLSHIAQILAFGNNVYLTFEDNTPGDYEVFFIRSTNGGASFDPAINLSNNPSAVLCEPSTIRIVNTHSI